MAFLLVVCHLRQWPGIAAGKVVVLFESSKGLEELLV